MYREREGIDFTLLTMAGAAPISRTVTTFMLKVCTKGRACVRWCLTRRTIILCLPWFGVDLPTCPAATTRGQVNSIQAVGQCRAARREMTQTYSSSLPVIVTRGSEVDVAVAA